MDNMIEVTVNGKVVFQGEEGMEANAVIRSYLGTGQHIMVSLADSYGEPLDPRIGCSDFEGDDEIGIYLEYGV